MNDSPQVHAIPCAECGKDIPMLGAHGAVMLSAPLVVCGEACRQVYLKGKGAFLETRVMSA